MKKLLPLLTGVTLMALIAAKTPAKKNNLAGSWTMISGHMDNHGKQIDIFGAHPGGMMVFTDDLHFMVVVTNPDLPKFASNDRAQGTPEEYKTAVMNSLGLFGTYTIDDNGDFLEQHVVGSTFQNFNGNIRGRNTLTEKVQGNTLVEHMTIADGVTITIHWQRTSATS